MCPVTTDGVAWSVSLLVCLSLIVVSAAKTAKPVEMPFGIWTWMGPRKHVLDGGCILAQSGEYDRTSRVRWQCGLMSNSGFITS